MGERPCPRSGVHHHPHEHAPDAAAHRHPHHHRIDAAESGHAHAHATSFESLTYLCSPLHDLDARVKLTGVLLLVVTIVSTPPVRAVEFALLAAALLAATVIARLPVGRILIRTAAVLPFAGAIALLAPFQGAPEGALVSAEGLRAGWGIVSKAWLSVFATLLLAATTPAPKLLHALRRLGVPDVLVMLLSFISRYAAVFAAELTAARIAIACRAPRLKRRVALRSFGSVAGSLFLRSYERGERIHAAMRSRGYTGTLPVRGVSRPGPADALFLTTVALAALAAALY